MRKPTLVHDTPQGLIVFCDDGSLWKMCKDENGLFTNCWLSLEPIPQPDSGEGQKRNWEDELFDKLNGTEPEKKECEHEWIKRGVCVTCKNQIKFDSDMKPHIKPPSQQDITKLAEYLLKTGEEWESIKFSIPTVSNSEHIAKKLLELAPELAEKI